MADNKEWQVELEEYIRQGEPDVIEKVMLGKQQ